jgi:hypothetical protein
MLQRYSPVAYSSAPIPIRNTGRHKSGRALRLLRALPFALLAFVLNPGTAAALPSPAHADLGPAIITLNGPWKFHTGDDALWADPNFDDSDWEIVDLTATPGAHDGDVGLTGYVSGWQMKSHRGYFGYAWYRLRISVSAPQQEALALCGPFYVDSAYQVYFNGRLLGGVGDFGQQTPVAHSNHLPMIYPLSRSVEVASSENEVSGVLAIRVWMGPWALKYPDTGGVHIAPVIGTANGAAAVYQHEWLEMIRGYIVDAIEGLAFVLLAGIACSLIPFDRSNPTYRCLAVALILLGLARANQAVFFWWQFETVQEFELATVVLLVPLSLAAWTMTWYTWFRLRDSAWLPTGVGALSVLYVGSQFLSRSWFYGVFPQWFVVAARYGSIAARWLFMLLTLLIVVRCISQRGREKWFALPAILLISVGLFTPELVTLHIPGIWFPFGTGVSLNEYAYAGFDAAFVALALSRLYSLRQPLATS